MRELALLLSLLALLAACGEPPVDVDIPARQEGQVVLDLAGILRPDDLVPVLERMPADVVALTFETEQANLGEAHRASVALLKAWDADAVLVAVAQPGDFTSEEPARRRFFGVYPADRMRLSADARERVVEHVVPPLAEDNEWTMVFETAAREVGEAWR